MLLKVTGASKATGRTLAFSCWLLCAEETIRALILCGRGDLPKATGHARTHCPCQKMPRCSQSSFLAFGGSPDPLIGEVNSECR